MFSFIDRETPEVARRLFLRTQEAGRRYLRRSFPEIRTLVEADFPTERRFTSYDEVSFKYPDLPDFSFTIMVMLDGATLSVFGGGRYDGFMLQRPAHDAWHIDVTKPISRPLGRRAKKLSEALKHHYGATSPRETIERLLGR